MLSTLLQLALFGFVASTAPAPRGVEVPEPASGKASSVATSGTTVELLPQPPRGALEEGLSGDVARYYASSIGALRTGQYRRALSDVRQARVLAYAAVKKGPEKRRLAGRHFTRVLHLEEQLSELVLVDEQLERPPDRSEQRNLLLHMRALLMRNLFLAVRGFLGISDWRMLKETLRAYQMALEEADTLKHSLLVGYAAMLAERGNRREARTAFAKLGEHEREQETMDLPIAYYYLALGDRARAITRLITASHRDSWLHGSPGREDHSFRTQVYRLNDFDRLRDHPRFIELVTVPEER